MSTELITLQSPFSSPSNLSEAPISHYVYNLIQLAVPNTLSVITWSLQGIMGVYFVGLLDDVTLLDAYALANSWTGIIGISVVIGLTRGMETLVSQSFGRGDYHSCGVHFWRAFFVLILAAIPCCLAIVLSGPLFIFMGIDPKVASYGYYCSLWFIPAIIIDVPLSLLEEFMIGQRIVKPQMVAQLLSITLYPAYCYIFTFTFGMGYLGAVIARSFHEILSISGILLYLYWSGVCSKSLFLPTLDTFKGSSQYLKVAFPAMLMTALEWWALEIVTLLCAKLGVADLAANTIAQNYAVFIYLACIGVGSATGTLVGNSIGERNINNAKSYTVIGVILTLGLLLLISVLFFYFRGTFIHLLATDPAVTELMETMVFLVILLEVFDGLQGTLGKTLVGMGKQSYASVVNLIIYYVIMVPFAVILGYVLGYGVVGVWAALISAAILVAICYSIGIYRQDWDLLVIESEERDKAMHEDSIVINN